MKKLLSLLTVSVLLAGSALAGRNDSFTGRSVFESGTLTIKSGVAATLDQGSTFSLNGASTVGANGTLTVNGAATLNGATTVGANGTLTLNGTATLNGTSTVGTGGSLIINGTARLNAATTIGTNATVTIAATNYTVSEGAKTALQSALSIQPADADLAAVAALTTNATGLSLLQATDAAGIRSIAGAQKNWVSVPATANATGTAGDMAYESGTLYICVGNSTWQKVTIATWGE